MNSLTADPMIPADSSPLLNFSDGEGIHLQTVEGDNYIVLEEGVAYPDAFPGSELNTLLLPSENYGDKRRLKLPDNFATFGHALNDAIGDVASERGVDLSRVLFERVGASLARVALHDAVVPPYISYKNIIFSREDPTPKLLPPIEFVAFQPSDAESAKSQVIRSMRDSLDEGAANITQKRHSLEVFAGFIHNFDW